MVLYKIMKTTTSRYKIAPNKALVFFACLGMATFTMPAIASDKKLKSSTTPAAWQLDAFLGASVATATRFTSNSGDASYIFPTIRLAAWYAQPWFQKGYLHLGLSLGYLQTFRIDTGNGPVSKGYSVPIMAEMLYRLPARFYATAGIGLGPGSLTVNGITESTNAFVLGGAGGYEYPLVRNVALIGELRTLCLFQTLVFPDGTEEANSSWNFSLLVGASLRFNAG